MPIRMPICFSDVYDRKPDTDELRQLLQPYSKIPTFRMIAMLNTLLSFYDGDEEQAKRIQGFFLQNLTDEDLFERLKQKFSNESVTRRPVFHRQQFLVLMKDLLLKEEDGERDPNLDVASRHDLGKACLMVNDRLNNEEQNRRLEQLSDSDEEAVLSELFVQLLVGAELYNPADVVHSVVRSDEFFRIIERRAAKFNFSNGETIQQRFHRITGLGLRRYFWLMFCLCVVYKHESEDLEGLMQDPGKFNIAKGQVFAKTNLTADEISRFFAQTASDLTSLTELIKAERGRVPLLGDYDFVPMRTYPLYDLSQEHGTVSTIDFTFLTEKLSAGIFHDISNSIRRERNRDWHTFSGFWGNVFEEYVNDRWRDLYPLETRSFYASPYLDQKNEEVFDGAIDYGEALVVMEYKGTYLTLDAKYSGNLETLMEGIALNVGKGVEQIVNGLQAVFGVGANDTFSQRGQDRRDIVYSFGIGDIKRVKVVYPVIVVQDFALQIGLANYKIRQEFNRELAKRGLPKGVTVKPLSLFTVEDLEKTIPYLADFTLPEILDEYVSSRHEPLYTFENARMKFLGRKQVAERPNEWIHARRQEINLLIQDELEML